MRYCSQCGSKVVLRVPAGDNLDRHVCEQCNTIHYVNPRIVAGCVVTHADCILICRRAIEPRKGWWTLPAGFLECGETIADGAAREAMEEACAQVELDALYTVVDVVHIGQVHMMYRGRLVSGQHEPGPESLETALVRVDDIPWNELAFPSVTYTLERFREDLERGEFGLHSHCFDFGP